MKLQVPTNRLYVAGFFLLTLALLVFVQAAFNLDPFFSPSEPTQIVLLYTLSTFIFLALLIFGFVLLRTVVKVWAERKQQKPGSKFKTSLLVSLISLTLIPATCLFMFGYLLVNRSIDKWLSQPVDQIFIASRDMNAEWWREQESLARGILADVLQSPEHNISQAREIFRVKALILLDNDGRILESSTDNTVSPAQLRGLIGRAI